MSKPKAIKLISVGVALILILSCNLPVPQAGNIEAPTQSQEQPTLPVQPTIPELPPTQPVEQSSPTPEPDVNFNGISFSYDKSLFSGVETAVVPASIVPDGAAFENYPEYTQFKFNGYVLQDKFFEPTIEVYPVNKYIQMSEPAAEIITEFRDLMSRTPAAPEDIPHLPIWNAAQMMQAHVKYLKFQNGSGVRFLTQYAQSFVPINNHDMFYCFQGMTENEGYFISVTLPVNHPSLPPTYESIPNNDWEAFSNQFPTYIIEIEQKISAQPADSFTPRLDLLDQMIETILVSK
ncbi:MAG: hypothetical protein WHV66_13150 [Anaerolineales bacterium]